MTVSVILGALTGSAIGVAVAGAVIVLLRRRGLWRGWWPRATRPAPVPRPTEAHWLTEEELTAGWRTRRAGLSHAGQVWARFVDGDDDALRELPLAEAWDTIERMTAVAFVRALVLPDDVRQASLDRLDVSRETSTPEPGQHRRTSGSDSHRQPSVRRLDGTAVPREEWVPRAEHALSTARRRQEEAGVDVPTVAVNRAELAELLGGTLYAMPDDDGVLQRVHLVDSGDPAWRAFLADPLTAPLPDDLPRVPTEDELTRWRLLTRLARGMQQVADRAGDGPGMCVGD